MRQVTIHAAEANLSELIDAALAGEEIVIVKGDEAVARIAPITHPAFRMGLPKGQLGAMPDFFEPMEQTELVLWEGGQ